MTNSLPSFVTNKQQTRGRALYVAESGRLYISRGYSIYRSDDWGKRWHLDSVISAANWKKMAAKMQLSARLLRHYVAGLQVLLDGTRVAIARDGVYRADANNPYFKRVFAISRGSRPLNIAIDDNDRVLFGEYGNNAERHEIFIYVSEDKGANFEIGYTFKAGDIRHVHNIIYDPYLDQYWVFVGDYGHEPGIGLLSKELAHLEWVQRGSQQVRTVSAIVEQDFLFYGTDTEMEQNHIVQLDKNTGMFKTLQEVEGTSLYASAFGNIKLISTCVEPSRINLARNATVYASINDGDWYPLETYRKDRLPFRLFQFGTVVLPYSHYSGAQGMFSGQALQGFDNYTKIVSFDC